MTTSELATAPTRRTGTGGRNPEGTHAGRFARVLDTALEATIVGSFSRIGWLARVATQPWTDPPRMDGRVVVVTGGSSGIGRAAALALGVLGAEVWVVGRDEVRSEAVADAVRSAGGRSRSTTLDVADEQEVDAFADHVRSVHQSLDGLVHCAGALLADYTVTPEGVELTVATHVLGPYRLTRRLAPLLRSARRSTIVTVSSGGMYTERFDLDRLEMAPAEYDGVRAYARAKRAQVVLAHEWSRRWSTTGIASYVMHPGWVDTPGLTQGLPPFARLGPLLRRPEEGADTAVWLAAGAGRRPGASAPGPLDHGIWLDRRLRGTYYLPWTRPRETPDVQGRRLWDWCAARSNIGDNDT